MLLLAGTGSQVFLVLAVLVALGCGAAVLSTRTRMLRAHRAVDDTDHWHRTAYANACHGWEQRRYAFGAALADRIDRLFEWGAVPVPPRTLRLDVFGGSRRRSRITWRRYSSENREAFLQVFGASTLSQRRVLVLDLTGDVVCEPLADLAGAGGRRSRRSSAAAARLGRAALLAGLAPAEMVSALGRRRSGSAPAW